MIGVDKWYKQFIKADQAKFRGADLDRDQRHITALIKKINEELEKAKLLKVKQNLSPQQYQLEETKLSTSIQNGYTTRLNCKNPYDTTSIQTSKKQNISKSDATENNVRISTRIPYHGITKLVS